MYKSVSRVAKNTIAQFAARGLELGTSFVVTVLMARVMGAGPLGQFAFLQIYSSLFVCVNTLGLNLLLVRELARRRDEARRYLGNALGIALVIGIVTFPLQVGLVRLASHDQVVLKGVYLMAAFAILQAWEFLFVGMFYALERMELETIGIFVAKVLLLAGVCVMVLGHHGVIAVLSVFVLAETVILMVYTVMAWRLIGFTMPAMDLALWRRLAAEGLPFGLNFLLTTVCLRINVVLLVLLASEQAAGYFRGGSTLSLNLPIIATGLNNALLPLMARAHPSGPAAFALGLERSLKVLSLIGIPMAVAMVVLGRPLVLLLFGRHFAPAIIVFQMLAAILPLKFASNTIGMALTAANRQPQRTLAVAVGAGVSVALNLALIPVWQQNGAGIAAMATDFVILVLVYFYLRRAGYSVGIFGISARPLLAAAAMGATLWWMRELSIAASIPAGVIVYGAAAVAVGAIRRADVEWLRAAYKSPR